MHRPDSLSRPRERWAMPKVECLGHVGINTPNLEKMVAFYSEVIGLEITDNDTDHGLVFLSADPRAEHHHLVLAEVAETPGLKPVLQQVSFRCRTLEDVSGFFQRFKETGTEIQYSVTHGNAIGVYFYDPDGNRCEVYWQTGLAARQAFRVGVDLSQPSEALLDEVWALVREYGDTGIVESGSVTDPKSSVRGVQQA
jgi:catechol-2,3-dioxygenase